MVPERAARGTLLLDLSTVCYDDDSEAPNSQFSFSAPSGVGSSSRFLQDPAGSGKIMVSQWSLHPWEGVGEAGLTYIVLLLPQREKFPVTPSLRS